jgi:hypothetical protein
MAPATVERPGAWHRKAEPSDAGESYSAQAERRREDAAGDSRLVLAVHPHYRTMAELSKEIGSKEAVERAVRKLSDYGLVRLHGSTLLLTDAAFYCHRLDAW